MAIYNKIVKGNAINYTKEVDGSIDYSGITNNTYFKDLSDGLIRWKDTNGTVIGLFESGGSSGKVAIYNSGGTPTYYGTLSDAMSASTTGDTVHLFTNITETAAVTLKTGVNINGNGFKVTFNYSGTTDGIQTVSGGYISQWNNLHILRTGGSGGFAYYMGNAGETQINASNVIIESDYGVACQTTSVGGDSYIKGVKFKGVTGGITAQISLIDVISETTTGFGIYLTGSGVYGDRCIGKCISGASGLFYSGGKQMSNSTGYGVSCSGIGSGSSGPYYNCVGFSVSNIAVTNAFGFYNGAGASTSYIAISGSFARNSSFTSITDNAAKYNYELSNCSLETQSAVTVYGDDSRTMKNCTVICNWNNASGHGIISANNMTIFNNTIKVTHASANCINGTQMYYANNVFEGSAVPVSGTQLISNTSDNQGNILK